MAGPLVIVEAVDVVDYMGCMTVASHDVADYGDVGAANATTPGQIWSILSVSLCNGFINGLVGASKKTSNVCIMREDLNTKCLHSRDIDIIDSYSDHFNKAL